MIEHVRAPDFIYDSLIKKRVGRIGIGPGLWSRISDPFILNDLIILICVIFSPFQPVKERSGYIEFPGFFRIYFSRRPDLFEFKSPALDAVVDPKAIYFI